MGTFQAPTASPGIGWQPFPDVVKGTNRITGGVAKGTIVVMALDNEVAEAADNNTDGGTDSGFANFIAVANTVGSDTTGIKMQAGGIFAISLDVADEDVESRFALFGVHDALVNASTNNIVADDPLIVDGATAGVLQEFDAGSAGETYKIVAKALEASTTDGDLISVLFNGVTGFGAFDA